MESHRLKLKIKVVVRNIHQKKRQISGSTSIISRYSCQNLFFLGSVIIFLLFYVLRYCNF